MDSIDAATRPLPSISHPSGSIKGGRFAPGEILAARYRIIDLLGEGGMGEVYRAEDMKLRQAVALKFLPERLADNQDLLERLYQEVSSARQVSHRNVCRVYDVGEYDGMHFISMEYVRGEELGSLLKRIGRLPEDKAIETARQLCAGIAAIHDKGILHRDLKPSNVMLDEQGEVRITDFGLAANADNLTGTERMSGTPAYMSPEQLAGQELTAKSDIYSLGLVLYELFTGKRAFDASSLPELIRLRESDTTPVTPTSLVKTLDPLVEQTILRCLEPDPARRPASTHQVAAALPGGDPLAAALAMGETPSPEIVAAASKEGTLRPSIAFSCLAAIIIATIITMMLAERVKLNRYIPLEKSTEVLSQRAADITRVLGYTNPPMDSASGWRTTRYLNHIQESDQSPDRWEQVRSGEPAAIYFWYRESPRYLVPNYKFINSVEQFDPEMWVSGMTTLDLSPSGKLLYFEAVPPQVEDAPADIRPPDWNRLFVEAGLDITRFSPAESRWVPPSAYDTRAAWEGTYPMRPDIPLRIEAAGFRGLPVHFRMVEPWAIAGRMQERPVTTSQRVSFIVFVTFVFGALIVGGYLSLRNSRSGRGDRKGAFRLSAFIIALLTINWLLRGSHVPMYREFDLFAMAAMEAALLAGLFWLFYMSLEPIIRRRWPHRIISWNRLLTGAFRDPLVGRDVLVGSLAGLVFPIAIFTIPLLGTWLGLAPDRPATFNTSALLGIKVAFAEFLYDRAFTIFFSFGFLFLFLIFYIVLRREWLAGVAFFICGIFYASVQMSQDWRLGIIGGAMAAAVAVFVLMRFGLLAFVTANVVGDLFFNFPLTTDVSAWYFDVTLLALGIFLAIVIYGFYVSLGGQKLLRDGLIPE